MRVTLRVAIVGYGTSGQVFHGPLLRDEPSVSVAAVVTSHPERAAKAQLAHPGVEVFASMAELLNAAPRLELDLAVIASANSAHVPQALAALDAGLHVVVDKPIAGNAADAQMLVDAAAKAQRVLTVFQNRRWDSDFMALQQVVADGTIGKIQRFESRFERWRPFLKGGWRESGKGPELGGLLLDLGSHLVDQAIVLCGPVERVTCNVRSLRDSQGPEDDFFMVLDHVDGTVSHLGATVFAARPGPRFRVLGSSGTFIVDELDEQEGQLRSGMSSTDPAFGVPTFTPTLYVDSHHHGQVQMRQGPMVTGQWSQFYTRVTASIQHGDVVPVTASEVVSLMQVLDAARISALEHRTVGISPLQG